jgi:hypothetical protein
MRDLTELYTLLHENFAKDKYGCNYICNVIYKMAEYVEITMDEYVLLFNSFKKNRPTDELHIKFYEHPAYSEISFNWFGAGERGNRVRTEFLKHLIDNHIK